MVSQYLNSPANRNYSPKTIRQVIATFSSFQHVLNISARHHLIELNSRDIEYFIEYLQDHQSKPNTINSYLSCLSGFYHYLVEEQPHLHNPDILQAVILGKVCLEKVIHTDGWRGYDGLVDVGYDKHFRVNHSNSEFSKGRGVHINGIESFRSFAKRRVAKFNAVKANFEFHLKESEWRWSGKHLDLEIKLFKIMKQYKNFLV